MTDSPDTTHPDDESLNAVLDHEGSADDAAHVGSCVRCSARLDRFASVAGAVATPIAAPQDEAREAALAGALAVFTPGIAPNDDAAHDDPAGGAGDELARARAARRSASPTPWILGVAAALLLVVGIGAVGGGLGGSDDSASETAASSADDESATAAPESAPQADRDVLEGARLGPVDDDASLRRQVDDLLDGSAGDELDQAEEPLTAADGTAEEGAAERSAAGQESAVGCAERAADVAGSPGALRFEASASFEGRPAKVYGFEASPGEPDLRVVVLTADDCELQLTAEVTPSG